MKLMDRYLLREMVVPFLIGQAAIVMMLTGTVLYNNADILLANEVPVQFVIRMVLYFVPFLIHMTMPVAMAVAASLAVSRLGRDSEITVMRASGISLARIFLPIFVVGLLASVGDFYFGEYVVPRSVQKFQEVLDEIPTYLKQLNPQPGQWIVSSDQSYAINIRNLVQHKNYIDLNGILIVSSPLAVYNQDASPIDIYAERGRFENGRWTLYQPSGFRRSGVHGEWQKLAPSPDSSFTLEASVDPQAFKSTFELQLPMWKMKGSSDRSFLQLRSDLARNRVAKIYDPLAVLNYNFKLSIPFSCLVMALCCPPMAMRFARGGGFMGTLLSICLVFIYWNTMLLMRILGSPSAAGGAAILPPAAAAWAQDVLFVALGIFLLRKAE